MKKIKLFSVFILVFLFFLCIHSTSQAALIKIMPNGEVISQVLGDSTLEIKSVSKNALTVNGKIEVQKDDMVEVVARENINDLKIGNNGNEFTIEENGIIANTIFPITIDPIKDELTVKTNSGLRLINILPFEATESLVKGKFIDSINGNTISLNENSDGLLQYSIKGTRNINLFNFAKISADVTCTVSASNGEILKIDEPQWLRLLGVIM